MNCNTTHYRANSSSVPGDPTEVIRREINVGPTIHIVPDGIETPAESRSIWRNMLVDEMRARAHRSLNGLTRTLQRDGIVAAARSGAGLAAWAAGAAGARLGKLAGRVVARRGSGPQRPPEPAPATAAGPLQAQGQAGEKILLWFGNHGSPYANSGLPDLRAIGGEIAELSRRHRIRVVVISNSRDRYERLIAPLAFTSQYVEWGPGVTEGYMRRSAVALIPSSLDEFSICKSANRTILALYHGVPVVATRTPALEPLASCVTFDDWTGGTERYLTDSAHAARHLAEGERVIREQFSGNALAARWDEILRQVIRS